MDKKPSPRKGPHLCSLRCGLAVVMHLSNLAMITQRVSLSIAVIAMVNGTGQPAAANASADGPPADALQDLRAGSSVYEWSPETQSIIFSSISYGIILTLVPSGYLAGIFGAKQMLGAGLLISSLLTLFTPWAADLGVTLLVVVRTVQGMAQGMAWTGQFTIWAKWAPPLERSKLTSIAGSGAACGSFIILCVGGLISQALGWPFIFYIFGGIGCACCLLWFAVIYDDPVRHPCISVREKDHIVSSLAQQPAACRRSAPLKAMARCLPLWAIFTGFFSHFWLCSIIVTYLPTYIHSVLHVNIREESSQTGHRAKTLLGPGAAPPVALCRGPALRGFQLRDNHCFADTYPWDQQPVRRGVHRQQLRHRPQARKLPHGHRARIRARRGDRLLHHHRLPHQPGFRVGMEERLFPVRWRQRVRPAFLPRVWAGGNPGLGQRQEAHPPLRTRSGSRCRTDRQHFHVVPHLHSFFMLSATDSAVPNPVVG
ncbi:sodium-dependent phosphate transport protein 3-like isoform 1-T1 [Glossophaga mutica]